MIKFLPVHFYREKISSLWTDNNTWLKAVDTLIISPLFYEPVVSNCWAKASPAESHLSIHGQFRPVYAKGVKIAKKSVVQEK